MDSFIFKGKSSKDFKIIINSLPTISKPPLRVEEIEIDGVDGARYEELGYGCYEKKIKITITEDNIDSLIDWLKGEGDLILSNEPDKYYNAKIIEQIDFERLMKYEPTEIKFRVQPFKYQYNEEKMIAKTGRVEGTKIKINDVKATQLQVDGRSIQEIRSGINKFNASLIPTSTGIVVNEDGSKIIMPLATSGNGNTNTQKKLKDLAPDLKVGDVVYLDFDRLPTNDYNKLIYLSSSGLQWNRKTTQTITQAMLDSPVTLYGNRFQNGETDQVTLVNFRMVLGESDAEWEQYGATPSPEIPSEIESVGYNNIWDEQWELGNINNDTGVLENSSEYIRTKNYISIKPNTAYFRTPSIDSTRMFFYDGNYNYLSNYTVQLNGGTFTTPHNAKYIKFKQYGKTYNNDIAIFKGAETHNYISFGKFGIEVETVGNNRWNNKNATTTSTVLKVTDTGFNYERGAETGGRYFANKFNLKANKTYTFSILDNSNVSLYIYKDKVYGTALKSGYNSMTYTPSEDVEVYATIIIGGGVTSVTVEEIQFEERNAKTEYEMYKKNTSSIILNAPLRSLPNGVKDIAYIKNNKLYVGRYVGSLVLNGSENWYVSGTHTIKCLLTDLGITNVYKYNTEEKTNALSNYFGANSPSNLYQGNVKIGFGIDSAIYFSNNDITLDEFKTWLSTHNTQVDYELATPITEELGDLTILELVDGENNISNSEDANMVFDYIEILNVNNLGNHTAKPIFEIEGVGKVDFMLNNSNVFSYSFDDDGKVVIDSEKEDAYLGLILKNRNMNGDFPIFNPGENKFTWDGLIKNISVSKKSRWL